MYIKNVARKRNNRPSGIQVGCAVGAWEHEGPYPRRCKLPCKQNETFPHAIVFNFKAIKTLGKGDAHRRFGFRERVRPFISVPCGHFRRRAEAYFSKRPEWAVKKVLGSVGEAKRNSEGEDTCRKIRAGRLRAIVEKIAGDNTRLLQYNTSAGFQLWLVWFERYQKVFRDAYWGRKVGNGGQEARKNHVLVPIEFQVFGHELWEVGENERKQPDKIMAALWVVWLHSQTGLWEFAVVSLLVLKTEGRVCLVAGRVWRMPASVPCGQ